MLDKDLEIWPCQQRAIDGFWRTYIAKHSPAVIVAPPGAGKSFVMREITRQALAKGLRVAIYFYRTMLGEQMTRQFEAEEIDFGVRASGWPRKYHRPTAPVQLCSLQTEFTRMKAASGWDLFNADIVLPDEWHQQTNDQGRAIFIGCDRWRGHQQRSAHIAGVTATPINLRGMVHPAGMISAGSYSELREHKAHHWLECHGLEEPDVKALKRARREAKQNPKLWTKLHGEIYKPEVVFGYVFNCWKMHNPDGHQTLLYAPDGPSARGFVELFANQGVTAASITDKGVAIAERSNGRIVVKEYDSNRSSRTAVREGSEAGDITLVSNRFILREAIDMPWLYCGIFACSLGSLEGWLQSSGRIQRYDPAYEKKILLDHGANFRRFGDPNADRLWSAEEPDNNGAIIGPDGDANDEVADPIICSSCFTMRTQGATCPACGFRYAMLHAPVRSVDGSLKLLTKEQSRQQLFAKQRELSNKAMLQALYACKYKPLKQALGMAMGLCRQEGKKFKFQECGFTLPEKGDPRWDLPTKDTFGFVDRSRR